MNAHSGKGVVKSNQSFIETEIKNTDLVREKRLQIAKGASKLFIKKGYFSTSMRDISKASGLTIGSLYNYITKKEDILYLVFDVFHSLWVGTFEREGIFEIVDPAEQLESAIRKMLQLVFENREMVLLMYTESKLLPKDLLKLILQKESGLIECFEKILRRGLENGVFNIKDPFLLANIIVYLLSIEPLRGWNLTKHRKIEEVDEYVFQCILNNVFHSNEVSRVRSKLETHNFKERRMNCDEEV